MPSVPPVPSGSASAPPPRAVPPTRPLRVLHVVQPAEGGVARVVTDLVRSAPAEGLHVTVAGPADGDLADGVRALGGEVRHWAATRAPGPWLPGEVRRLGRLIDDLGPDVVHAHSSKAGLAARLAVRGTVPTVFQPHAWSFEAARGTTAALATRWERYGARWAARIVCVSEAERRTGQGAGIDAAWSVVPNGVDTGRFSPAVEPPGPPGPPGMPGVPGPLDAFGALDALDRPGTTFAGFGAFPLLVVCVARLCHQKGQDVLLRAWPAVARQVPGARLVLVGDGPAAGTLRRAAHPSVTFAGPARDTVGWYRAADLVVLPSRWEGMALAPLEAQACGTAVLLTDVDGARESLPAGHAPCCLVPPRDPAALGAAMVALLRDAPLRAALGRAGRRHVLAAHDVRRSAAAIAGVYRAVAGTAPGERPRPSGHAAHAPSCPERRESVAT